ncbi:EcsC family protein [Verticiella sediminum]|uniref:EcsC family protein n=1 Tax=Verticiella sediminum TaxID=1247510 RepID=A0A556B216_9BURK|nr:EcsC family protein [Verticiella sediminum]TSH99238.1 EcsC family protein [Verticiella sediminum]
MSLSASDLDSLAQAKRLLEHPGLAARLAGVVGAPIERGLSALPGRMSGAITEITRRSLDKALNVALLTMKNPVQGEAVPVRAPKSADWWHKIAVGTSGAVGGAFGMAALTVELPISTTIMLRSIADIARSNGENLALPQARLECLQVLALGGPSRKDDASDAGYFAARAALAQALHAAALHLSQKGLTSSGAPVVVKLVAEIATRFSVTVSEKAVAQAVPVIGALGGAAINALFIDHFQDMGRGHFTVRRLERHYGEDAVREAYQRL